MADSDELENSTDEQVDENEAAQNEEQTDWNNLQQIELNARKKAAMNQFKEFRRGYVKRLWPYLNPSEKLLVERVKKISPGDYAAFDALKKAKQQTFESGSKAVAGPLLAILPYVLIGLLVIVGIVAIISVVAPWLAGVFEGASGAPFGVNGENFYGVRYVYRDAEQAQADLWAEYANALNYAIENFEDENVTLNLKMPMNNEELDLSKLNSTAEDGEFADEYALTVEIAKSVYLLDNANVENVETEVENLELAELLAGIKFFGLDANLVEKIATNLAQNIENNSALFTLNTATEGGGASVDVAETLQTVFNNLLLQEYVTNLGGDEGAPTRTDLLYIKDYILGDDAESTVDEVCQENYVAMIYLPKKAVEISSVTYSIYGVETAEFNLAVYSNGSKVVGKTDSNFDVFMEGDEETKFDTYHYEVGNLTFSALALTDFEKDFLTTEKSLFNILRVLTTENDGTTAILLSNYLQRADANNTAFWMNGETAEGETKTTENYYTFNYQTYLAVLMQNYANTAYSFTEYETNLG